MGIEVHCLEFRSWRLEADLVSWRESWILFWFKFRLCLRVGDFIVSRWHSSGYSASMWRRIVWRSGRARTRRASSRPWFLLRDSCSNSAKPWWTVLLYYVVTFCLPSADLVRVYYWGAQSHEAVLIQPPGPLFKLLYFRGFILRADLIWSPAMCISKW
jgi:hypothetical protein